MYDELKAAISEWFSSFGRWKHPSDTIRFTQEDSDAGSAIFCTAAHTYHLHFNPRYLGCTACSRFVRPGEDWMRGNDLPDGPFSKETFDNIMQAVTAYELVALVPPVEAQPDDVTSQPDLPIPVLGN